MTEEHACVKPEAWRAQYDVNRRTERTFEKIECHLGKMTGLMEKIAAQGERIDNCVAKNHTQDKQIDLLFDQQREHRAAVHAFELEITKQVDDKVDRVPWYKHVPAITAILAVLIALVSFIFNLQTSVPSGM